MRVGIGPQRLHRVRSARPAGPAACSGSVSGVRSAPVSLSRIHAIGRQHVQRRWVAPAFAERGVEGVDDRAPQPQLDVVPRRAVAVARRHLHRLRVAEVVLVVAAGVAQVDPARERDVALRGSRMADDHQLLMVRSAEPDPLIEQHLAACALDRRPRGAGSPPRCTATCQGASATSAPSQSRRVPLPRQNNRRWSDRRRAASVGVATPVGEEHVVARAAAPRPRRQARRSRCAPCTSGSTRLPSHHAAMSVCGFPRSAEVRNQSVRFTSSPPHRGHQPQCARRRPTRREPSDRA